jgi:hypothetical protein
MVKICINILDSADGTTMVPDGASFLCTHLIPCPPSRLRGTMPPRPTVVDMGSGTPLHLRATSSQRPLEKQCPGRKSSITHRQGDPDLGFPPEQHHLQPTSAPKMMPSRGVMTLSATIIRSRSPRSRVFLGAARVKQ